MVPYSLKLDKNRLGKIGNKLNRKWKNRFSFHLNFD